MGESLWTYYFGVLVLACKVNATVLESIYWNTTNTKFVQGQGLVLYPQIGDKMDIVCPRVEGGSMDGVEYYKLYMVPREQLDSCTVTKADTPLLNCVKPDQDVKFTLKFQEFSPNLWGLEFFRGKDYYIISTSNGTMEGLENQEGGVCKTKSMKIVMKVGQNPSDPLPPKEYPTKHPPKYTDTGKDKSNEVLDKPGTSHHEGETVDGGSGGKSSSVIGSEVALFAGVASACVIAVAVVVMLVVLLLKHRRRHGKHSPPHTTTLSLGSLATPKRGGGNNNGSEPSDIIIPLRTADSVFCPHYEKVSGDYGHPVYIVQEMPPQSPANIYYKV
ncbi:ephrin-B2a isoform X1 [Tachysurus fulvidraco]|uniref:ephrin-B2a isoform X1 n=2 Tax=Tachysurus fulvidraco TaxID=1234273 RepID=UPI000F50DC56|nr:ephrin-B2a isoform X1 [Tachysurus fulvidraco]